MAKASVTQPARYQGDKETTKYVNKVEFDPTGAIKVTAVPLVGPNLLIQQAESQAQPKDYNEIVAKTKVSQPTAKTLPSTTLADPQGIVLLPQPPGPRR